MNYLFIGHPDAGWMSATIYSITTIGAALRPEGRDDLPSRRRPGANETSGSPGHGQRQVMIQQALREGPSIHLTEWKSARVMAALQLYMRNAHMKN